MTSILISDWLLAFQGAWLIFWLVTIIYKQECFLGGKTQLCQYYFLLTLFSQVSLRLFPFCNFLQLKCFLLERFFHFMSLFSHTYHSFTGFPLLLLLLPAAAVAEVAAVGPVFNSGLVRVPPWPVKLIHLNVNRKSQLTTLLDLSTLQPTFSWIKIKQNK